MQEEIVNTNSLDASIPFVFMAWTKIGYITNTNLRCLLGYGYTRTIISPAGETEFSFELQVEHVSGIDFQFKSNWIAPAGIAQAVLTINDLEQWVHVAYVFRFPGDAATAKISSLGRIISSAIDTGTLFPTPTPTGTSYSDLTLYIGRGTSITEKIQTIRDVQLAYLDPLPADITTFIMQQAMSSTGGDTAALSYWIKGTIATDVFGKVDYSNVISYHNGVEESPRTVDASGPHEILDFKSIYIYIYNYMNILICS